MQHALNRSIATAVSLVLAAMPILADDVCHEPLISPIIVPAAPKSDFGWYVASRPADTANMIASFCDEAGITGIRVRVFWKDYLTISSGGVNSYNDALINTIMDQARAIFPGCRVFIHFSWKNFTGDNAVTTVWGEPAGRQPCPVGLKDSFGNPGALPSVDSVARGDITAATNANPIVITTDASAQSISLTNGDKVYIERVGGNTAANNVDDDEYTISSVTHNTQSTANTHDDTATFALTGRAGNGAYTSGGKWTIAPMYACKMWDSTVAQKWRDTLEHMANYVHFAGLTLDNDPNFEGLFYTETALGVASKTITDTTYGNYAVSYVGDTYDALTYANAIVEEGKACGDAFDRSRCVMSINFLQSSSTANGQAYLRTVVLPGLNGPAARLLYGSRIAYGQPDIIVSRPNLYNNPNAPYNIMRHWIGVRTNSFENDSYDEVACNQPSGASTLECLSRFYWRGTFGTDITTGTVAFVMTTQGMCGNAYGFINDKVNGANQITNVGLPLARAHPYGPEWYQNCAGSAVQPE